MLEGEGERQGPMLSMSKVPIGSVFHGIIDNGGLIDQSIKNRAFALRYLVTLRMTLALKSIASLGIPRQFR